MLISGIGAFVIIYASVYLAGHIYLGRFYLFILLFMSSMLGLVLSDNVMTFFVFWELTSITSYFLIGFNCEREESRKAALQALLVTGIGGLALLAGLIMMGSAGGSYEFSDLMNNGELIRNHSLYIPILLLILTGAFTKSAQVPFQFWLPAAMEAPTPISAYLHSATMVKAGVFLIARLSPVLGGTELWFYLVSFTGAATMVIGGYMALHQADLKKILAYSTVCVLGALTMLLGFGTHLAFKAAMVFLFAHALYKASLFLIAGIVDHGTGTRDIIVCFFMASGACFMLLASIGILRFPDLFSRMHAATKSASFGVVLIMVAVCVYFAECWVIFEGVMLIAFIFITSPVAYHMIGRAAYFLKIPMWEGTIVDELRDMYDLDKHITKSGLEFQGSMHGAKK